jgi:transcriptional regulator with XRE-family HTH domain
MATENVRLKQAMARAGYTPASLALKMRISRAAVNYWLTGETKAPLNPMNIEVAELLGVDPAAIWPPSRDRRGVKE